MQPIDESMAWNKDRGATQQFPEPSRMPGDCQSQAQSPFDCPALVTRFPMMKHDRFPLHRKRN
jgi:hypothetical protein